MKDKIIGLLVWCGIILLFVGCNRFLNTPDKSYKPDSIRVNIEDLEDIKDLANDNNRDCKELLNEISNKIDEIIEYDRVKHENNQELNEEARQDFIEEQLF